ncbi:MAG: FlgD immunoglobulin-like domain containing protein, partial [Bacteroidota bacterium]
FDANNGIALGDPVGGRWVILRTSDGGVTWVQDTVNAPPQVGTEAGWINSFHAIGTTHFWFGTDNSRIYRTTNGGVTWSSSPTTAVNSYAVWFNDTQNGVAAFTDGSSARSSDGGATWTTVPLPGTGTCYGVAGVGGSDFWVSRGAAVYKSTDRGATWASDYASTIGTSLRHMQLIRSGGLTSGWVVSSTGGIARYGVIQVGVDDDVTALPQDFTLLQNYPNPFNPATNIRYGLPRASFVTVKIYNILGQEVATLKNEIQGAGAYDVVWYGKNTSGHSVASGVYFYRLEAKPVDGSTAFNSFKKMLLLK